MERMWTWESVTERVTGSWTHVAAPGLVLIFLGIAIVLFPALLALAVAAVLMGLGCLLLWAAWMLRRMSRARRGDWEARVVEIL